MPPVTLEHPSLSAGGASGLTGPFGSVQPLPRPAQPPAEWIGRRLARVTYEGWSWQRDLTAVRLPWQRRGEALFRPAGSSFEDAVSMASVLSSEHVGSSYQVRGQGTVRISSPFAVGVLQSQQGAWFVGYLGNERLRHGAPNPATMAQFQALAPELKAVVGDRFWVDLRGAAADAGSGAT